ncbi:hypothetical protein [Brachybacterium nesterenkovii]|uniref:hypothetical protein n=1 Tax=Brachybacterium nesterenkovii TaxID=47847 RepID=UPI00321B000C
MKDHQRALDALAAVLDKLGLPAPDSISIYAPDAEWVNATAVYGCPAADLPDIGWNVNTAGIPIVYLDHCGAHIAIQAHPVEAVAA